MTMNFDDIDKRILREALSIIAGKKIEDISKVETKDDLIGIIEELCGEVEHLQEEYDHLENDLESNYRPIPLSEMYEVYDHDFI